MLQHFVMLTLIENTSHTKREAIIAGLRELPQQVPGLTSIDVRSDAGLVPGGAQLLFQMSFIDEKSWREYTAHPAHEALANDHIRPNLVAKTALQTFD